MQRHVYFCGTFLHEISNSRSFQLTLLATITAAVEDTPLNSTPYHHRQSLPVIITEVVVEDKVVVMVHKIMVLNLLSGILQAQVGTNDLVYLLHLLVMHCFRTARVGLFREDGEGRIYTPPP